jgi:hypothetical protein
MNNFVFSLEKDLPRKLYVVGFRIIFLMEKRILDTGDYITDLNDSFEEAFFNGTMYGEDYKSPGGLLYRTTFPEIMDSINDVAEDVNVNISLMNPEVFVTQTDAWNVKVGLKTDLLVKDKGNLALWNRSVILETYIPIENFEDPVYFVESESPKITNKINRTPYSVPISPANLLDHAENSYYINSTTAPGFLDRLEGKFAANGFGYGIESLVYIPDLINQKDKSIVDYIYFSENNPIPLTIPSGMPGWLKIDPNHTSLYGV